MGEGVGSKSKYFNYPISLPLKWKEVSLGIVKSSRKLLFKSNRDRWNQERKTFHFLLNNVPVRYHRLFQGLDVAWISLHQRALLQVPVVWEPKSRSNYPYWPFSAVSMVVQDHYCNLCSVPKLTIFSSNSENYLDCVEYWFAYKKVMKTSLNVLNQLTINFKLST